ncbi:hypothetical protein Poli38472_007928 [Pythium oligandrum]|uniref:Uncharacterized protein n=1 Tax=Pythium oligandrum TaxID=41045 RepID=A0A8K1CKH6_PYTOL|nr:hypothetical protein Poli38472_007928 [Pythium oligandrum]|eukprot:TMW65286.1 hypothetical protein Poli38472_007928 [Pythium oligandrum]
MTTPLTALNAPDATSDAAPLLNDGLLTSASNAGASRWPTRTRALSAARVMCSSSTGGGASWIVKGLLVCVGMVLMGAVGSFTLHQMMSPQIESLLRQRNELQRDMYELQNQVDNMTRIAESRLETIHLLEKELERQAVAAAAAADAADLNRVNGTDGHRVRMGVSRNGGFWPIIVYAWVIGGCVLLAVAYRVSGIARIETQQLRRKTGTDSRLASLQRAESITMEDKDSEDDEETGLMSGGGVTSSSLFKRPAGSVSPPDRLMHV